MASQRTALLFGAGKLGCGFVAEVLMSAGCHVVFVSSDEERVDRLARAGAYTVYKARRTYYETVTIEAYDTLSLRQEGEIAEILCRGDSIVALAIHMQQMDAVCMALAVGLARRAMERPETPLDILLCVNNIGAKDALRLRLEGLLGGTALEYLHRRVGIVSTVELVSLPELPDTLLERDPLGVLTNGYPEMPVDATAFQGEPLVSPMIRLSHNIEAETYRKMYSFNMAYAVAAYMGVRRGHVFLADALADARIREAVCTALEEASVGLMAEYGYSESAMADWNKRVLDTLDNPLLQYTLNSLGTDTPRKVAPQDRLVGPAMLTLKHGGMPRTLARAIAHAYRYPADNDVYTRAFLRFVEEEGIEQALERYSRLAMRNLLHRMVRAEYEALGGPD